MNPEAVAGAAPPPHVAQLVQLASATDAQLDASAPGAPLDTPLDTPDRGAELGAMLAMIVAIATPALPFLPQCYSDDTCRQIGTAVAAVAAKYGWSLDLANAPELALALVTVPPTINAVVMGREHFAAKRRALERPARDQVQLPPLPPLPPNA